MLFKVQVWGPKLGFLSMNSNQAVAFEFKTLHFL